MENERVFRCKTPKCTWVRYYVETLFLMSLNLSFRSTMDLLYALRNEPAFAALVADVRREATEAAHALDEARTVHPLGYTCGAPAGELTSSMWEDTTCLKCLRTSVGERQRWAFEAKEENRRLTEELRRARQLRADDLTATARMHRERDAALASATSLRTQLADRDGTIAAAAHEAKALAVTLLERRDRHQSGDTRRAYEDAATMVQSLARLLDGLPAVRTETAPSNEEVQVDPSLTHYCSNCADTCAPVDGRCPDCGSRVERCHPDPK